MCLAIQNRALTGRLFYPCRLGTDWKHLMSLPLQSTFWLLAKMQNTAYS